ncbi:hypothetical protein ACRRTK_007282 [Alexandromys fortis]
MCGQVAVSQNWVPSPSADGRCFPTVLVQDCGMRSPGWVPIQGGTVCEHSLASRGICAERHVLEDRRMRTWRYPRCGPCPRDRLEVQVRNQG